MLTLLEVIFKVLKLVFALNIISPMHCLAGNTTISLLCKLRIQISKELSLREAVPIYELLHVPRIDKRSEPSYYVSIKNAATRNIENNIFHMQKDGLQKRHPKYYQKIFTQGRNDRQQVPTADLREYPYYNIVRLSVGCTGTLITPSFILTAAHCVHDGETFKKKINLLKIEILHRINYRTHYVKEIIVPKTWIAARNDPPTYQSAFDYALIRLQTPVLGRTSFTPLDIPDNIISDDIYFVGYSLYTHLKLWKSECSGWESRAVYHGNILVSQCDTVIGNSGASVYVEDRRTSYRRLIGVLSSTSKTAGNSVQSQIVALTTLMTKSKVNEICSIISPEGQRYRVCETNTALGFSNELKRLPFYG